MKTVLLFSLFSVFGLSVSMVWAEKLFPPWTKPPTGGVTFTVPCVNDVPDLHGDIHDPDLVVFFGGNQFMVLPELMAAFQERYPEVRKIYFETLPPGIIEEQLKTGSLVMGNLRVDIQPDVFVAGQERINRLEKEGFFSHSKPYFQNRLAIMVAKGNPSNIQTLNDLGRDDVNVSMPNPETEGVAQKIIQAFRKAGGDDLVQTVMNTKQQAGSTFITQIHHRQTPMRILMGQSDAGAVWQTEIRYQQMIGNPVDGVPVAEPHNETGVAAAAVLKDAPHARAADHFYDFLSSEEAAEIYRKYGFEPLQK